MFIYQLLNTTSFSLVFPVLVVSKMLHKMEIMSTLLMCACVISYLFIVVRMWNKQSCLCKSSLNSLLEPFEAFSNDGKSLLIYESMRAFDGVRTQTSLTTSPRRPTKNKFSITHYGIQITSVLSSSRLHCVEWTYTKLASCLYKCMPYHSRRIQYRLPTWIVLHLYNFCRVWKFTCNYGMI